MDICDYDKGLGGYRHALLVTDRWSGIVWDYYLRNREGVGIATALASLFGILERQYQLKPRVVECDNEFNTGPIKAYLLRQSVRIEPFTPNTPAQNRGAERSGGVIASEARAMRAGVRLPEELWLEIVRAAVYLNRQIIGGHPPYGYLGTPLIGGHPQNYIGHPPRVMYGKFQIIRVMTNHPNHFHHYRFIKAGSPSLRTSGLRLVSGQRLLTWHTCRMLQKPKPGLCLKAQAMLEHRQSLRT